jgi:hypothetical protein
LQLVAKLVLGLLCDKGILSVFLGQLWGGWRAEEDTVLPGRSCVEYLAFEKAGDPASIAKRPAIRLGQLKDRVLPGPFEERGLGEVCFGFTEELLGG